MKHVVFRAAAFSLLLCGLLSSQTKYFYIPDSNAASGNANVIPFGTGSSSWANQRCQFLLKKNYLPAKPGVVRSVGFAPAGSGTYLFKAVVLKLGHNTSGTLGPTFAASFSGPVFTVFNQAAFSWKVTANQWNRIPLSRPFVFNGKDNLVLDVLALGSDLNPKAGFHRATEPRYYKVGVRPNASVQPYGKGCAGSNGKVPVFSPYSFPWLGANFFRVGLDRAKPQAPAVLFIGRSSTKFAGMPLPLSLGFMGAPGCDLNVAVIFMNPTSTGNSGKAFVDMALPNAPALERSVFYMQWAVLDPKANQAGMVTTQGLKAQVGSVPPSSGSGPSSAALKVELGFF